MEKIHGDHAELSGEDARHLTRVLRAEAGQIFEISDNHKVWLAEIAEVHGARVVFRLMGPVAPPLLPAHIALLPALVKFDRFEWMIEKATELGVEQIAPLQSARTEKGLGEAARKRVERWRRIARESSQQSRRSTVPEILPAERFETSLASAAKYRYFLEEAGAPPLLRVVPQHRSAADSVALMLGPEGGWTDDERRLAAAAGWVPVSLGPLVLRAETAAAAALAVVVNAWMTATIED